MILLNKPGNILDITRFLEDAKLVFSKIKSVVKIDMTLRFELLEDLTTQEDSDLSDFILNFADSDPDLQIPLIYDIAKAEANHKHFHNIDYIKEIKNGSALIPLREVVQGEVRKVTWYETFDDQMTPINPVLVVDINYTRLGTGFATMRTVTRTWINRDGSENSDKKITPKYYFVNPSDMIGEGLKRRKLLVSYIQIPMLELMKEVLMPLGHTEESVILIGRTFLDDYEQDFGKFVENSSTITDPSDPNVNKKTVVVAFEDNSVDGRNANYNSWLDKAPPSIGGTTTIRQYLVGEFSI